MFSQMRLGLQDARALENDRSHRRRSDPTELAFSTRDALTWATVNGARALGAEDRLGSLTPGKQADVIVVGPGNDRLNMLGLAEPVASVVQQANPANVQAVLVAGRPVKLDGRLLDVDFARVRDMLDSSREAVLARTLADGPLLPEVKPSFDDLALGLLPNLNVPAPGG
jgi:5-methylthioadenosine/S-adenosylhomocysteine deaminase